MAHLLWGKVYLHNHFAGILQQEPGDGASFTYDPTYLNAGLPPIAHTLPLRTTAYINHSGLHPFFDNLIAEGWLEQVQARTLGQRTIDRFSLLLAFGMDCAGAISILDPEPTRLSNQLLDLNDTKELAILTSNTSLSGVQPKLAVIARDGKFYPTQTGELSTHIAKFPSQTHPDLLHNEYLTTQALKALLPYEQVVELCLGTVEGIPEEALLIKRFDRTSTGRIHFEEFNQLLNYPSSKKYDGSHKEMADFIRTTPGCLPAENVRLLSRICAGLLLGNTDMHFKNFAMLHTTTGLRLSPIYDTVAAALYEYKTVALAITGTHNFRVGDLSARNIIGLAKEFSIPTGVLKILIHQLEKNKTIAQQIITDAKVGTPTLKQNLTELLEKRWNGTFALIGTILSKKL